MGNKLLVLNHKMNLNLLELTTYLKEFTFENKNLVVCPSSIYVPYFLKHQYQVGIQNVGYEDKGAFTGEISPLQARTLGISYAIIGHSERREIFKEDNALINKKILKTVSHGINAILCIGEKKHRKNTKKILKTQIKECLKDVFNFEKVVIAYEPIWAIGTGLIPTNDEIENTVEFIKKEINKLYNVDVKVLYGGSVNEENIGLLNQIKSIDGYLVGGASLNIEKVRLMIEVVL